MSANKRLRVLISAYACEPQKGSEPGVGWNLSIHMAELHDIWVLTRSNNRPSIDAALELKPISGLHFVYYDLPHLFRLWKKGSRGARLYYYLWHLGAARLARKVHKQIKFNLGHHVTFVKYWTPSIFAFLKLPFIWGPVGGGESAPFSFFSTLGTKGIFYELARITARRISEFDPLVHLTAKRATYALATTPETAKKLHKLGSKNIEILSEVSLSDHDIMMLNSSSSHSRSRRFLSIGRLLPWKGFQIGIQAFAESELKDFEYWILGTGPFRAKLENLTIHYGLQKQVRFCGHQERIIVVQSLIESVALIHPSLHDSGGWVSIEAMAAGVPVICLDLGGPAIQVTKNVGFKIQATTPRQAIDQITQAIIELSKNPDLCTQLGENGQRRVRTDFTWKNKINQLNILYQNSVKPRI